MTCDNAIRTLGRLAVVVTAVAAAFVMAGCGRGADSPATSTPAEVTPSPQPGTPGATGLPATPPALPESLRSIVRAIVEGDSEAIRAATRRVPTECAANWCPAGVEAGTAIPIIRAMGCEPLLPNDMPGGTDGALDWFTSGPRVLLAVFDETLAGPAFDWVPRGSHEVVVWATSMGWASAFHVSDGGIAGIRFGCGHRPQQYCAGVDSSRFLVGPLPYP